MLTNDAAGGSTAGRALASARPVVRPVGPAVVLSVALFLVLLVGGPTLQASGSVLLQYSSGWKSSGTGPFAPFQAMNLTAGIGGCLSRLNTTLPFGSGSARASSAMVEPRTCPTRTTLTFLPSTRFTNGLATPAGHVLNARLDLVSVTGTLALLRNVQLYIQRAGGLNPILTPTHIVITRGAVVTASTSLANVSALFTYGIGLVERLNLRAVASTATLTLNLVTFLNDGGLVRAVDQQRLVLTLSY